MISSIHTEGYVDPSDPMMGVVRGRLNEMENILESAKRCAGRGNVQELSAYLINLLGKANGLHSAIAILVDNAQTTREN